jgi:hypothetical protein
LREEVLNTEDAELDRSGYEYGSRRVSALEAKLPYQRKPYLDIKQVSTK